MSNGHEEFEGLAALDAVDATTPEERRTLDLHLATCDSCRRARDEFAEAASALARDLDPMTPPAGVRGAIMDVIDDVEEEPTLVVRHRRLGDSRWWLATAATVLAALWGWRELAVRASREKIASQDAEIQTLIEQNTLLSQRAEKISAEMNGLASGDTRTFSLAGQQVSPAASARVFLEPSKRRAVVFFANLPVNPNGKSYQLWIIRGDQVKPQSAGVFDASQAGGASLAVENLPVDTVIKAMAVTLEPKGGVEQPTSGTYYVMGKS